MTRVRANDYEDKKQVILDSAVELIARKGFDGATMSEADIIENCRAHLARFKCQRHVVFGPLPKTSTRKIQK